MTIPEAWVNRPYKQLQEEFVSNHGGDLPYEVLLVFVPNITSILLASLTLSLFNSESYRNIQFFIQFVLIVVPSVLCCTVFSNKLITVSVVMDIAIIFVHFNCILQRRFFRSAAKPPQVFTSHKIPVITNFRAMTYLLTSICILAVDFPIFPRRFAKTETSGYSLMDTGVGLFIFCNALVSPEARSEASSTCRSCSFGSHLLKTIKSCIPLLAIGIGRAVAIEYFDYQRHISEYGVHWNFFITLAFVKLFSTLILGRINSRYSFVAGLWLLAMHEYILSSRGFKHWILGYVPRDNFVTANREGLISLPGYIGLYLCCISIGQLIISAYKTAASGKIYNFEMFKRKIEFSPMIMLFIQLFLISGTANAVTFICEQYFGVSRRLANFGYASWIITLSTVVFAYLMLIDAVFHSLTAAGSSKDTKIKFQSHSGYTLEMFEAINYNGLCFFLVSNISTGIINMSVRTLFVSATHAVRILIGYVGINVLTVLFLYRCRVQLKL